MPDKFVVLDTGLPSWSGSETLTEKVDALYSHQFQLVESLRYMLRHLDISNFNEDGLKSITDPIAISLREDFNQTEINIDPSGIEAVIAGLESTLSMYVKSDTFETTIETLDGDITRLQLDMNGIETRVEDSEKNYSSLEQTVDSFSTRIETAEGNASTALQTANSFETRITTAEGNSSTALQTANGLKTTVTSQGNRISTLEQTSTSLTSRITTAEGDITSLEQTVDSFTLSVSSSNGSTTFKLMADGAALSTKTLDLTVEAANISGKLTADQIEANALTAGTIQGEEIYILHDDGTEIGQIVTEPTTTGDGLAINTDWGGIRVQSNYGNVFLKSWKSLADSGDATPQLLLGVDGGPYVCAFSGGALVLDALSFGSYLPDNPVYGQVYFLRV